MAYIILLIIHIAFGSIALLSALVALLTAKGRAIHVSAGRVYAIAMTGVFVTAIPLAIIGSSVFLLLIAVFSFYLVFAGWRFARNRRGRPHWVDWAAAAIMTLTGLGMWGYSVALGLSGDPQWMVMLVYGAIARCCLAWPTCGSTGVRQRRMRAEFPGISPICWLGPLPRLQP